jgi:hypothetical protein
VVAAKRTAIFDSGIRRLSFSTNERPTPETHHPLEAAHPMTRASVFGLQGRAISFPASASVFSSPRPSSPAPARTRSCCG